MGDMGEIWSILTMALLGLLVIMVLKNMLWGMKRGAVPTLIRIGTMVATCLLLLAITPIISKMLWDMFLESLLSTGSIEESMKTITGSGAEAFTLAPLVLVNIVVFIVLQITLFKWISYLAFRIIAGIVAPRKDKETGEKKKRSKLLGMLAGVAQGLVAFFFFMLPINALFYSVNAIEGYQPTLSASCDIYSDSALLATKDDDGKVTNLHQTIRDLDKDLNGGIYGTITKITGMQAASGSLSNSLYTIPETKINIRADIVTVMQLTRDLEHIADLFSDSDIDTLTNLTSSQYAEMNEIVDRFFNITTVREVLDADTASMMEEFEMNDKFNFKNLSKEENELFQEALLEGVKNWANADSLKNDVKSSLKIMRLLFSTKITGVQGNTAIEGKSMFVVMDNFFEAMVNSGGQTSQELDVAQKNLSDALNYIPAGSSKSLLDQIFIDGVGGLSLFTDFLFGGEGEHEGVIAAAFIADAMDTSLESAKIDDFRAVMKSVSGILVELVDVASEFSGLMDTMNDENSEGMEGVAAFFQDEETTESIVRIMEYLTDSKKECEIDTSITCTGVCTHKDVWGIARIVRNIMATMFEDVQGEPPADPDAISVETMTYDIVNAFVTRLRTNESMCWADTLSLFGDLTSLFDLDFENGTGNAINEINVIINGQLCTDGTNRVSTHDRATCQLCKPGLLDKMKANPIFSGFAAKLNKLISDEFNKAVAGSPLEGKLDHLDPSQIVELAGDVTNLVDKIQDVFGGESFDVNTNTEDLVDLANDFLNIMDTYALTVEVHNANGEFVNPLTGEAMVDNNGDPIDLESNKSTIEDQIDQKVSSGDLTTEQKQKLMDILFRK